MTLTFDPETLFKVTTQTFSLKHSVPEVLEVDVNNFNKRGS